tara:strand:- start:1039 stop:1953 length:915 start_codon:yes stop_codon:yes gene_type:complete
MKEWNEYKSIISEVEEFQKKMAALNDRSKKRLFTGGGKNTAPYTIRPPIARSKSAPPGFGAMGESDIDVVPEVKDDLNRDIWEEDNSLKPEISEKLLRIAKDFYERLDLPVPILDITFTGSMANYNWTDLSDIDLHIVIDYKAVNENQDLVRNYLMEAKSNWNRAHDIRIKGHEVEIYVQDSNEPHHSTAVYSVSDDDWIIKPRRKTFQVSEDAVTQKAEHFVKMIDYIQKRFDEGKYEEVYGDTDRLRDKLKNYRQSGLETGGEFSVENLVFKYLRNTEEIGKIMNLKKDAYDAMMSVSEVRG